MDALRPGILGNNREAFAKRYCNRKLVPVRRRGRDAMTYDNSGLSHGQELHMLLKKVGRSFHSSVLCELDFLL